MPGSAKEKRETATFLITHQRFIYNLSAFYGFSISDIQRELVWELRLGWVSYGRLQDQKDAWEKAKQPAPWPSEGKRKLPGYDYDRQAMHQPQNRNEIIPERDCDCHAMLQPQHQNNFIPDPDYELRAMLQLQDQQHIIPETRPATFSTSRPSPTPVEPLHVTDPKVMRTSTMGTGMSDRGIPIASNNNMASLIPYFTSHITLYNPYQQLHSNDWQINQQQNLPNTVSVPANKFTPITNCVICGKEESGGLDLGEWEICVCG